MRRNKHRRVCFGDRVRLGVHVWPLINQWEGWQVYLCMSLFEKPDQEVINKENNSYKESLVSVYVSINFN